MGTKKCNDCPNNTQYVCMPDHTCCKKKTPADFPAGMCGWQMDDGCGGKLDVPCTTGSCPIPPTTTNMLAQCCVNTNVCPAGNTGDACGQTVTNSCTGAMTTCQCNAQNFCKSGVCTKRKTCADFMANGADGQMCSNGGAFDDGSGTLITCPCAAGGTHYCISGTAPNGMAVSGSTVGTCCTDTATCGTMCNTSVANTCINTLSHTCGAGSCGARAGCNGNTMMCVTCASLGATGGVGSPCSNGGAFDVGNGTLIPCPCTTGICINGSMMVVTGANKGTCCLNSATCPAGSGNICNYTGSPNNTCTGLPLTCGKTCPSGQHCNAGSNGTCVADNNCSNIGVNQGLTNPSQLRGTNDGNPCNDLSMLYQKTGGGFFNCRCTQHALSQCTGETTSTEGTCTCVGNTCSKTSSCNLNGQDNGCGVPMSCACNPGDVCFGTACCTPKNQCNAPPSGIPMGACNYSDTCGGSVGTQCCPTQDPVTHLPIEAGAVSCVPHSGANPAYGDCVCTPTHKCTDPGIQNGDNDGCGHALVCQN
jgi:hypothetical protein